MWDANDWLLALGAGFCAVGGLLVYRCHTAQQFLAVLKDVEEFQVDDQLRSKVEGSDGFLSYVGVRGLVSADSKVIHSQSVEEAGVIKKTEIREHKASWNNTFENWSHQQKNICPPRWELEPFSLISCDGDDSSDTRGCRVHVDNP